jgi:hypothetical protein
VTDTEPVLLLLSESDVLLDADALFDAIVPSARLESNFTVSVKTLLPTANEGFEHDTVPVPPTAGVVQLHPVTAGRETKVEPAGSVSLHEADVATSGPLFVTVIV